MNAIVLITLLLFAGCNGKGGAFSDLEDQVDENNLEAAIVIEDFIPKSDPLVITASSKPTFAISVNSETGIVRYRFQISPESTPSLKSLLRDSTSPFVELNGADYSPGVYDLSVTAQNTVSSAQKTFKVRRNTIPTIISSDPSQNGNLLNCDEGTLVLNALSSDLDLDSYTQTWLLDGNIAQNGSNGVVFSNSPGSSQLSFTPSCEIAGFHTITLRLNDGYETYDHVWNVSVANPSVETILAYNPTSNNIVYFSTDTTKSFSASGSGVGALTFLWKLDGVTVHTQSAVTFSTYNLLADSMGIGTHILRVELTDSSDTNNPPGGAFREWSIYKNQKPRIISPSPSAALAINLNTPLTISALVEDALDTFQVTMTKGAFTCTPNGSGISSTCGLSEMSLPSSSGSFSATFNSGALFLGENQFQLKVVDSYGEQETRDFTITSNYFSNTCNQLAPGQICTLAGLQGLGSGTSIATSANKVRINPHRIIKDERGNWFFSDSVSNTVWYYNRSLTPVSLLNVTVPAQSIYVVAGTGAAGAGINGVDARKMALSLANIGGGLAWDPTRQELFIADYNNNRVIRVDSFGKGRVVCGLANLTAQGSIARNTRCINPSDLAFDVTNRRLYVAQLSDHIIKVIDASNADFSLWTAWTLSGSYGDCNNLNGSTSLSSFYSAQAGSSRVCQPIGLYLDEADQILYWSSWQICRVGAIGLPGSTTRTVAGQAINAGQLRFLAGSNCASPGVNTNTALSANLFNRPIDLHVDRQGDVVRGIYVTNHDTHRVMYINNLGVAVTIGGQTVNSLNANNVFGNGTPTSPTNPPSGRNSVTWRPYGVLLDEGVLYVGAADGSIIRALDVSVSNGAVTNILGGTSRAGYSGNAALDSSLVTFNSPLDLFYKESGGTASDPIPSHLLFVSDFNNFMIRSINLTTGRVEDFIGTGGSGAGNGVNTVTTSTQLRGPRSMAMNDGFFMYSDTNENCYVRAYNPFPTDETLFSTLINQNRTNFVLGNYNVCGTFGSVSSLPSTDPAARLNNPWGIGVDGQDGTTFVASHSAHCIIQITSGGTMTPYIGTCGTMAPSSVASGSINSSPANAQDSLLRFPATIVMDPLSGLEGNFFFIDFSDVATANIKYVNRVGSGSVNFFGGASMVAPNTLETVMALVGSPGWITGLAAFENWICFSSGSGSSGLNNITCRDRSTGTTQVLGVPGIGGIQLELEHEGASATSGASSVTFSTPSGLAFDRDGNLYVVERGAHVIRKIARWF